MPPQTLSMTTTTTPTTTKIGFQSKHHLSPLAVHKLIVSSFPSLSQIGWFQIEPSVLGLSLTLLLQLSGLLQWAVRQSSEVINMMVAVERVSAYANLEPEAPLTLPTDTTLCRDWPHNGTIEATNLSVRYRDDLPLVLRNASFVIRGGERVGVVGRTGSGKSTIIQSIFRLLEPETGSIRIDGIDLSKVGLHTLRTRISVIPQVPFLFSGSTIRENLDPFGQYSDERIHQALVNVQMKSVVDEQLPNGIYTVVAENGGNLSVGQRQLLCVARSVLQQNKILILDEPTANVDHRTDVLLQRAVASSFPGATVIAVAHRLDKVIDFDKIMVVGNQGKVLEFGAPHELLTKGRKGQSDGTVQAVDVDVDDTIDNDGGGYFAAMVSDTGVSMARQLRKRAATVAMERERIKNQTLAE